MKRFFGRLEQLESRHLMAGDLACSMELESGVAADAAAHTFALNSLADVGLGDLQRGEAELSHVQASNNRRVVQSQTNAAWMVETIETWDSGRLFYFLRATRIGAAEPAFEISLGDFEARALFIDGDHAAVHGFTKFTYDAFLDRAEQLSPKPNDSTGASGGLLSIDLNIGKIIGQVDLALAYHRAGLFENDVLMLVTDDSVLDEDKDFSTFHRFHWTDKGLVEDAVSNPSVLRGKLILTSDSLESVHLNERRVYGISQRGLTHLQTSVVDYDLPTHKVFSERWILELWMGRTLIARRLGHDKSLFIDLLPSGQYSIYTRSIYLVDDQAVIFGEDGEYVRSVIAVDLRSQQVVRRARNVGILFDGTYAARFTGSELHVVMSFYPTELVVRRYRWTDSGFEKLLTNNPLIPIGKITLAEDRVTSEQDGNRFVYRITPDSLVLESVSTVPGLPTATSIDKQASFETLATLDVNEDGHIHALDVLLLVNFINVNGTGFVIDILDRGAILSNRPGGSTEVSAVDLAQFDVNRNGVITALDALLVINRLNQAPIQSEGEAVDQAFATSYGTVAETDFDTVDRDPRRRKNKA